VIVLEIGEEEPVRLEQRRGHLAEHVFVEGREIGHPAADLEAPQGLVDGPRVLGRDPADHHLVHLVFQADLLDFVHRAQHRVFADRAADLQRIGRDIADQLVPLRQAVALAIRGQLRLAVSTDDQELSAVAVDRGADDQAEGRGQGKIGDHRQEHDAAAVDRVHQEVDDDVRQSHGGCRRQERSGQNSRSANKGLLLVEPEDQPRHDHGRRLDQTHLPPGEGDPAARRRPDKHVVSQVEAEG